MALHQTVKTAVYEVDYISDMIIRRNALGNLRGCGTNYLGTGYVCIFMKTVYGNLSA